MAPVGQYVFAETPGISGRFTAGRHECLPYSVFFNVLKTDLQTPIWLPGEVGGIGIPRGAGAPSRGV